MSELYDFLDDIDLSTASKAKRTIETATIEDLFELQEECYKIIQTSPTPEPPEGNSLFNFSASRSISGAGSSCIGHDCRLREARTLSNFASLYGERVVIPNFINHHTRKEDILADAEASRVYRYKVLGDIQTLLTYRPLVEQGLIVFNQNELLHCSKCMAILIKHDSRRKSVKNNRALQEYVESIIFDKAQFILENSKKIRTIDPDGFTDQHMHSVTLGKSFGKGLEYPHELTRKELSQIGLLKHEAGRIIGDVILQSRETEDSATTFLTPRKLDALILERLAGNDRPGKLADNLVQELPIIMGGDLSALIQIRRDEEAAFSSYRHSLGLVLRQLGPNPKPAEVREAMDTEVRPHLLKINQTLQSHAKNFKAGAMRNAGITAVAIAVGIAINSKAKLDASALTGLSTIPAMPAIAAARDLLNISRTPTKVMEDKYYFLWKMSKK